jgi:hypothetical protein
MRIYVHHFVAKICRKLARAANLGAENPLLWQS